jgi:hypothetical protein
MSVEGCGDRDVDLGGIGLDRRLLFVGHPPINDRFFSASAF